ncbi:VOC family protein [Humisphaera borealis]|uniref:VOC family protein n=1 Tax=Humisphaera borealis TaxID=2807512 RepID=A0A7M2WYE2_9BACT|nr:VOC family protein [Humisphaera borealis]QOV90527.1 VOC family protein [Humisphaera borealis]
MSNVSAGPSTIIPCLRYRKAPAAIDWLCQVFGFQKQAVYGDGEIVHHAQLTLGGGMVMLGSVIESEWGKLMKQPDEIGGFETQAVSLVVSDADAVYQRATQAGAAIVIDIRDESYGGRSFTCRDLEGHVWNVGTYNPWKVSAG